MPLRVVLRGIADALDAHAHSWGRHRKVGSLAYCAAEVDVGARALAARARAGRGAGDRPRAPRSRPSPMRSTDAPLDGDARVHAARPGRGDPRLGRAILRPCARSSRCSRSARPTLLARLRDRVSADRLAEIEGAADAELAPYAARMPAAVLAQIRRDSVARRVLALFGIPRLSLFHL